MSENHLMGDEMVSSDAPNNDGDIVSPQLCLSEQSTKNSEHNLRNSTHQSDDDDEYNIFHKTKRRLQRFSDSESEPPEENDKSDDDKTTHFNLEENNKDYLTVFTTTSSKSRIRKISVSEDDASDLEEQASNYREHSRVENKKERLKDKFQALHNSKCTGINKKVSTVSSKENSDDEYASEDEMTSIDKIKEKIKERTTALKMSICDPDTSDEESNQNNEAVHKSKKQLKRTKLTSPKPQRMSAKQAMENMQKIKSESNRMLREKEVSLPYHRPKALSLQDIMKRRRPAVTSDGKALPIKMNEEQLKQYALSLEERQREMMELCKSDTEDDEPEEISKDLKENVVDDPVDINSVCNIDTSESNTTQENDDPINKVCNNINIETYQFNQKDSNAHTSPTEIVDVNDVDDMDSKNKSGDVSAELELVYNDSIEENENKREDVSKEVGMEKPEDLEMAEKKTDEKIEYEQDPDSYKEREGDSVERNKAILEDSHIDKEPEPTKNDTEIESQFISLNYVDTETVKNYQGSVDDIGENPEDSDKKSAEEIEDNDFPDEDVDMDELNMDEIDSIIENAVIIKHVDSPALVKDTPVLNIKPKLTGAPGMVIDLDDTDPTAPKKLTGVELLKERFSFFANLKTPEEMEREREKRQKPGTLHLKLKQELEDKIAEQRSLEWSKRLDTEKQQQKELSAIRGDESEPEDDIDKIEAKLDENDIVEEVSSSESEEEPIEDDILLEDKPKKRNPLVADEAEESDGDETMQDGVDNKEINDDENEDIVENEEFDENDEEKSDGDSSEEEESSESEDEVECNKPKKGRILKAFEDSDDEETSNLNEKVSTPTKNNEASDENNSDKNVTLQSQSDVFTDSQDDVLQLAQVPKQTSGDLFTTPECSDVKSKSNVNSSKEDEQLGTQTFSILNSNNSMVPNFDESDKLTDTSETDATDKLSVISKTQPCDYDLDAVVGMCSGSFSQNCVEFQPPTSQSQTQLSQSLPIGEDVLNMCTGNFYDNQFVSPVEDNDKINTSDDLSQDPTPCEPKAADDSNAKKQNEDILKSVLDELNEPINESVKPLKFFFDGKNKDKENEPNINNTQNKKRLVIDSDDETNDTANGSNMQKKKKMFKKKKLKERALQISDDEESECSEPEGEDEYLSDIENEEDKLVEYDSEENEVVIPQVVKKKKKKASEFFEQEAELTSEDEWVGSGDEDEAGLDRMEREEGDDETFHQGKLQRELGQIHMRDVLDQDKREVRLIQELLFEDGDLGAGGRQRKFRWRNADGEEASGTVPDEFADTQEEEFESEEQWRKQRHEREMFLRQMKSEGEKDEELDVSVSRTTIIKANLTSRTMSSLLEEVNQTKAEMVNPLPAPEKKTSKDIPSPKKSFPVFQQNYHGSLLTRGRGALARLAALATPLVADDDAPHVGLRAPSSKRNFVFAAITPEDVEPKVTKRKAENNVGTPRLVKKMKTEEKQKYTKNSLLDHMKTSF